jgi:SOS regulatory protein LexA
MIMDNKIFLDIRTIVLYTGTMDKKRTIKYIEQAIASFYRDRRRMPTYSEMLDLFGVKSKSVVHYWIGKLIEKGVLEKDAEGFLKPLRSNIGLPMVGNVAAGFPSPAEEELRDIISFDEYLINRPESSFLLKVTGDSMMGAGIMEDDLVIVEKGREPKNGDIVLAEVDGDWTMKYFRREGKVVMLEAANPKYPVIRPKAELKLGGIITAVIRKYHQ